MDETADEPMPAGHAVECLHEALAEQRKEHSVGRATGFSSGLFMVPRGRNSVMFSYPTGTGE